MNLFKTNMSGILSILFLLRPMLLFSQHDWEKEQNKFKDIAIANYRLHEIGDSISILLEVNTAFEDEATGNIICTYTLSNDPDYKWTYNHQKDIKIKGTLTDKEILRDSSGVKFALKIYKIINEKNINGFWGGVGDTTETDILYMRIE